MEEFTKSIDYQNSLDSYIGDRTIFQKFIFNNPVVMAMFLVEEIKKDKRVKEVEYEGSTSCIFLTLNKKCNSNDCLEIVANAITVLLIRNDIEGSIDMPLGDSIIREKMNTNYLPIDIISACQWLNSYVMEPHRLYGFFKVMEMGDGKFNVFFN